MRGHRLIQAIAWVNRVFRDTPGGLVVDYLVLDLCTCSGFESLQSYVQLDVPAFNLQTLAAQLQVAEETQKRTICYDSYIILSTILMV